MGQKTDGVNGAASAGGFRVRWASWLEKEGAEALGKVAGNVLEAPDEALHEMAAVLQSIVQAELSLKRQREVAHALSQVPTSSLAGEGPKAEEMRALEARKRELEARRAAGSDPVVDQARSRIADLEVRIEKARREISSLQADIRSLSPEPGPGGPDAAPCPAARPGAEARREAAAEELGLPGPGTGGAKRSPEAGAKSPAPGAAAKKMGGGA